MRQYLQVMVLDGIYYAVALSLGGALVSYLTRPIFALPLFIVAAFCLYFFRDPNREIPPGAVAVSPADGKVVSIKRDNPESTRISIFLNIFDVHVNRSPVAGKITKVQYQTGKFLVASKELASSQNEQNTVTVDSDGSQVVFAQIAGLIARRIVFDKKAGDMVQKGERIGLIKFGSRVDVFLGPEWNIVVKTGERVSAGSSVLAERVGQASLPGGNYA
ncbi:MAG: phosphatidylserine decarboxylase [Acidobacteriota bacterium]|nr:phosphatidylserine decarboxylase [Acidobacteriota bacterium]